MGYYPPSLCDSYILSRPPGRLFLLPKLIFQRLRDLPVAVRLEAVRKLVASDPHMPAPERRELFEAALCPKQNSGGWIQP